MQNTFHTSEGRGFLWEHGDSTALGPGLFPSKASWDGGGEF